MIVDERVVELTLRALFLLTTIPTFWAAWLKAWQKATHFDKADGDGG
jgi:hypothetical protein